MCCSPVPMGILSSCPLQANVGSMISPAMAQLDSTGRAYATRSVLPACLVLSYLYSWSLPRTTGSPDGGLSAIQAAVSVPCAAVLAGMRYLFIHSMTAISATIFLVSVRWSLITTRILECMTELQFAQACAFSIVLIILVFIASGFMALLAKLLCRTSEAGGGVR